MRQLGSWRYVMEKRQIGVRRYGARLLVLLAALLLVGLLGLVGGAAQAPTDASDTFAEALRLP